MSLYRKPYYDMLLLVWKVTVLARPLIDTVAIYIYIYAASRPAGRYGRSVGRPAEHVASLPAGRRTSRLHAVELQQTSCRRLGMALSPVQS